MIEVKRPQISKSAGIRHSPPFGIGRYVLTISFQGSKNIVKWLL